MDGNADKQCIHHRSDGSQCSRRLLASHASEFCEYHDPAEVALRLEQVDSAAREIAVSRALADKATAEAGIAELADRLVWQRAELARVTELARAGEAQLQHQRARLAQVEAREAEIRAAADIDHADRLQLELFLRSYTILTSEDPPMDAARASAMAHWCDAMTRFQCELRLRDEAASRAKLATKRGGTKRRSKARKSGR